MPDGADRFEEESFLVVLTRAIFPREHNSRNALADNEEVGPLEGKTSRQMAYFQFLIFMRTFIACAKISVFTIAPRHD